MIQRHPQNPVLTHEQVPYAATLIFNAGVCKYQGKYVMVFRNDFGRWGDVDFDGTNLGLAFSDDGLEWDVAPQPCIDRNKAVELIAPFYPHRDADKELHRFYDPRLTVIDGQVVMCFAVDTTHGLRGGIAVTDDFENWKVVHLTAPDNRNMVLFPEKIRGDYVRLERPFNEYGGPKMGAGLYGMWLSRSSDMRRWGDTSLVMTNESVPYANDKIGPGAPPIRTEKGWLCIFHAVHCDTTRSKNGWEKQWPKVYYAGLALLDIDDPTKVIGVHAEPLISPEADYETGEGKAAEEMGFRNHVIFPGGAILEDSGEVKIYYGAADSVECVAIGNVCEMLSALTSASAQALVLA
ncbi:glycoside hydrolase family 130 protein [Phycisphaerales bacterium AB-hyl4]|uniref:Glycoside hydrolase family 130 protein n=1 Tax=Natronomicrosphaera hydrolytica TaxID=3242702 RepID=A0ABV4U6V6_9BACT